MDDFWTINGIALVVLALFLIVVLLMYIAYKISNKSRKSR